MKDCSSEEDCGKKYPQKTLVECDTELETYFKGIEDAIFDRKARNETLRSEEFHPPSGTLFEALFKELKRREKHESHKPSLSNTISLLRARVAPALVELKGKSRYKMREVSLFPHKLHFSAPRRLTTVASHESGTRPNSSGIDLNPTCYFNEVVVARALLRR